MKLYGNENENFSFLNSLVYDDVFLRNHWQSRQVCDAVYFKICSDFKSLVRIFQLLAETFSLTCMVPHGFFFLLFWQNTVNFPGFVWYGFNFTISNRCVPIGSLYYEQSHRDSKTFQFLVGRWLIGCWWACHNIQAILAYDKITNTEWCRDDIS